MDINALKKFAQAARTLLIDQVTSKLAVVLDPASAARREHPEAMKALDGAIADQGKVEVIEQVAYTWFNRFTALRFMDVNGYTLPRVVSPADGATRPEILAEAMAGNLPERAPPAIAALLDGRVPSNDSQGEAYRLLLVHACNAWHQPMPFLFEKFDDYSELLMPDDLLSSASILARLREVLTEEVCADVEVIGWLYQFYISEKKDQVFAGLKKHQKITAENIPAATQLFTPHWIVRYLVENSLGRLWLLNRPASKLAERMEYFIAPEEAETHFLKIGKPEEIRVCDPACGSGHMLTYAFDLLYAIYEEEGYEAAEIPALILANNLTGVEIDDRAGALAAFALAMKAGARLGRRRFLRMTVKPAICVLQNVRFTAAELQDVATVVGRDLFTDELRETLGQFEQAKNFGSLIVPKLRDPAETLRVVETRDFGEDLLLKELQARVIAVLSMAEALSPEYQVVVANPPYMGSGGMNPNLKKWIGTNYDDAKADLYAAFIARSLSAALPRAFVGMVTMQTWMFLTSLGKLRNSILSDHSITSFCQIGYNSFPELNSKVALAAAFIINTHAKEKWGIFFNLNDAPQSSDKRAVYLDKKRERKFYLRRSDDFRSIPNSPLSFWASQSLMNAFKDNDRLKEIGEFRIGMATGQNDVYVRNWHEVACNRFARGCENREAAKASLSKWFPYAKGGPFRRWAGNQEYIVNWENDGNLLQNTMHTDGKRIWAHNFNLENIFKPSLAWTQITTGKPSFRFYAKGYLYDAAAGLGQAKTNGNLDAVIGLLNSKVADVALAALNPTINLLPGDLGNIPSKTVGAQTVARKAVTIAQTDWDASETSWDFATLPLLSPDHRGGTLEASYSALRARWQSMSDEMQALEEENNRVFIDAYGLQDELVPEVPIEEISLTCNPAYRYGGKARPEDLEERLRADTMAEFLHYAVGCMFGRYSLDASGLILANQGEGLADYVDRVPNPTFEIDADNVIPVLEGEWFADDITGRFRKFLRVTFGEAKFQENLAFIEDALGKDVRKWFTKDFFDYHVRRFKKRPIYWMFSSPKGSFNALIYMHRYRPDVVSIVLNDYLREFISKLQAERARLEKLSDDPAASPTQRTRALKDVATVIKQIDELEHWEREVVFPLAQAKIEIDLDDGVKRNYPKFGAALNPIKGLETADE